MKRRFSILTAFLALLLSFQVVSFAQTRGSIGGSVVDQNGAVVADATVTVKGNAGPALTAVTGGSGLFNVPAVGNGLYTVTVTAKGFKTFESKQVKVDVGAPTTVNAVLEVGDVSQTITITSGGEVLQTATPAVATTLTGRQITETPITSRDALDLVTLLPGTAQVGRPRQSSINGLPKGSLSISIDGVDVQDNLLKSSDGFFTFVRPRIDAIEEVSVSTAAAGSDSGGDGAVQIKFVTKRGTNDYKGSLVWQYRSEGLNSNYWFNNVNGLPRNKIRLNQYGGTFSGPIPYPHFGDSGPGFHSGKDKAFFFLNYEEFRIPEATGRTRTFLTSDAANGIFRYGANQSVNVLNIAQAAGLTSSLDPTISSLNSAIRASTSAGTVTSSGNPNTSSLNFIAGNQQVRKFLTLRFDVNVTKRHSVENVYNRQNFGPQVGGADLLNGVDPSFPGFPNFGNQTSIRYSNSTAVRSTLTNSLVNEARLAHLWGTSSFFSTITAAQFANQGGNNLNFNFTNGAAFLGLTNVTAGGASATTGLSTSGNGPSSRTSPTYDFTDNMTWVNGRHTIAFGGQYKTIRIFSAAFNQLTPNVNFGIDATDPADAAFSRTGAAATVPGASAAELAQAKGLYALLTGRVTDINGTAYLGADGSYAYNGKQAVDARQHVYGLYGQDSWRIQPNLTLNFGLRWQPQEGFVTNSANFSAATNFAAVYGVSGVGNLFMPGTLTGSVPTFSVVPKGYRTFNTDYMNFGPSAGFVYSPDFGTKGFWHTLFGDSGKSVIRAGYSRSFVREGTNTLLSILQSNAGAQFDASRNVSLGTLPVGTLYRNRASITVPSFPTTPPAVITGTFTDGSNVFNPNLKTGTVDSYSVGYQRELSKNTVLEVRYVGNRGKGLWRQYNVNEINVTENGFTNEFRAAQANLAANNAAGGARAGSFAFFGAGTGTTALPILQSYFLGVGDPNNSALYTSTLYRNATLITNLNTLVPSVIAFAQNTENNAARRANALAAGRPSNFFYVNPTTRGGGSFLIDNSNTTSYDSIQIELRRRLSNGLLLEGSYTFSKSLANAFASSSAVAFNFRTLRNRRLDQNYSPFDVAHAVKLNWLYELPFGNGGHVNHLVDALIGGWGINGALKLQSGTPINFGNVGLVGMTRKDLQKAVGQIYYNQSIVYNGGSPVLVPASYLPTDIVQNTNQAFNLLPVTGRAIVPATYNGCIQQFVGQCGFSELIVHGPKFVRLDTTLQKRFKVGETRSITLGASAYNVLNNAQWRVGGWAADTVTVTGLGGTAFGRYTTGTVYQDTSTTNDQGGRTVELKLRVIF